MALSENKVLLDPSVLVAGDPWSAHRQALEISREEDQEFTFYWPSKFVSYLNSIEAEARYRDSAMFKFYRAGEKPVNLREVKSLIQEYEFESFEAPRGDLYQEEYELIVEELSFYERYEDSEVLVDTLYEEYYFLFEQSSIVSRSRKTLNRFVDFGATKIEVGQREFEEIVRKKLDMGESEEVDRIDKLRTVGKWVAENREVFLPLFTIDALTTAAILGSARVFLAVDPE